MIKVYRSKFIKRTAILFVGLLFLNMNFFLAEVVALDLHKDQKMVENIAKLVAGAATEEEKDCAHGQDSGPTNFGEIDLPLFIHSTAPCLVLPSTSLAFLPHDGAKPITQFKETVNPPPEV